MANPKEKPIYKATVDHVAQLRHQEMDINFPVLDRSDYASDAAYRQALVNQYQAMRQQEFQYVITDEATKAYMVAAEANCKSGTRCQNTEAWNGYNRNRDQTIVRDSAFHRTYDIAYRSEGLAVGASCCAISSTSLIAQISGEMGYDNDKNLIQPKSRMITLPNGNKDVGRDNNPGAASWIERLDSIPKEYRLTPDNIKKRYPRGVTLNQAIKDGVIKAGDEVSIVTNPGNTDPNATGCHAMVVVDVQKDAKGKVTSYTLQCNNPPCLNHVDANNPDYYGSKPLKCAVKVNDWMNDKIKQEATTSMTTQQLQTKADNERKRLSTTIDDLQKTENYLASHKEYMTTHNYNKFNGYSTYYNTLEATLENNMAAQRIPLLEEENRKKEQELAQREAALQQREAKYQADLLAFNPNAANCPVEEAPAEQQQTPTPQKDKSNMTLQERADAINAKTEELRRKELELDNKEHELSIKEQNLAQEKADAILHQSAAPEVPDEDKKKNKKKKDNETPAQDTQPTPAQQEVKLEPVVPETTVPTKEPVLVPISVGEELREQTGEIPTSDYVTLKSGPMYKGTEIREKTRQLQETSNEKVQATYVLHISQDGPTTLERSQSEEPPLAPVENKPDKPKEISISQLQRILDQKRDR